MINKKTGSRTEKSGIGYYNWRSYDCETSQRAQPDREILANWATKLQSKTIAVGGKIELAMSKELGALMEKYPDKESAVFYSKELEVVVDPVTALFSAWYEMFPRSCSTEAGRHGTFKDCESRLPYISRMGFDVLYLPPIHPIGNTNRKGKNNSLTPESGDPGTVGSGSKEGGHKSVHPQLGNWRTFAISQNREYGTKLLLMLRSSVLRSSLHRTPGGFMLWMSAIRKPSQEISRHFSSQF
jgi:starch synthase (maltosyl-transferring)